MKTLGDKFEIGFGARDEHGEKLEPEEQPVRRVLQSEANVTVRGGEAAARPVPLSVTAEMSALEAETLIAEQCRFCAHWRQDEFRADRENGRIARIDLDVMRARSLDLSETDEINLTAKHRSIADPILDETIGKCMALSAIAKDAIYAHREATCPDYLPNGTPVQPQFHARPDAKRLRAQVHDAMMRRAQGRLT